MSTVNGKTFANTSFPNTIQSLPTFTDLSALDQDNYLNYLKQILLGDTNAEPTLKLVDQLISSNHAENVPSSTRICKVYGVFFTKPLFVACAFPPPLHAAPVGELNQNINPFEFPAAGPPETGSPPITTMVFASGYICIIA